MIALPFAPVHTVAEYDDMYGSPAQKSEWKVEGMMQDLTDLVDAWSFTNTRFNSVDLLVTQDVFDALEGNGLLQIPIPIPPQVIQNAEKLTKIAALGVAALELLKEWWNKSKRLTTVRVRCTAHQAGTPDHANTGEYFEGSGTGKDYFSARKAAIDDAEAKIVAAHGPNFHAQHCHDIP